MQYISSRPFEDNLRELADLFKYYGKPFFFAYENIFDANPDLEEAETVSIDLLQSEFEQKGFNRNDFERAVKKVAASVDILVERVLHDELTEEEKEEVVKYLTLEGLSHLTNLTKDPSDTRAEIYFNAAKQAIDWSLAWHYHGIDSTGASSTYFTRSKEDSDKFIITTEDIQGNILDEKDLSYGETHRYAEQNYTVVQTESNTIRLSIGSILPRALPREIEFPITVDTQQYLDLTSTEDNKGWEKAFALIPIGYKIPKEK